jgi:hypothetical protein
MRDGTLAEVVSGFLGKRRAEVNRESSIKAPFGFGQDCMPVRTFFPGLRQVDQEAGITRKKGSMQDVYRTLNKASTVQYVSTTVRFCLVGLLLLLVFSR